MVWCVLMGMAVGRLSAQSPGATEKPADKPVGQPETVRVFYTGTGQFEIITIDSAAAQQALTLGAGVWRALESPLGLPKEGFSSAVTVRLIPESKWTGPALFSIAMEPGGWVGVRVRWSPEVDQAVLRRALVQALLLRQAVSLYGAGNRLNIPLWLEQACAALSLERALPAMLDAMQQESARLTPPALEPLLQWRRGDADSRERELASFWLLRHLLADSGNIERWRGCLRAMLGGSDSVQALQGAYGTFWKDAETRELWWRVGFYNQSRSHSLPILTQEESRAVLADRGRWLGSRLGIEQVMGYDALWNGRQEPWIKAELAHRTRQLRETLTVMHPFYRNAAISMGRMYEAALKGAEVEFKEARAALESDLADGRELEDATGAALDAMSSRR